MTLPTTTPDVVRLMQDEMQRRNAEIAAVRAWHGEEPPPPPCSPRLLRRVFRALAGCPNCGARPATAERRAT